MASDHLAIRAKVRRLDRGVPTVQELHGLGEVLEAHVRFEERQLFPLIEAALDAASIAELGSEIASAESDEDGEPAA